MDRADSDGGGEGRPPPAIDVTVLRGVIDYLYQEVDDLNFVTEDLLRPERERHWGHLTHVEKREEAHRAILSDLDSLSRLLGIDEPDDATDEPPPG